MPALNGQVIMTLTDSVGAVAVCVTWFYNPATRLLRNNPASWTAPDGTVYPANSGAFIADNQTGRQVKVAIIDQSSGELIRQVRLPAGGRALTATQLANAPAPDGPYTTIDDLNGITFDVS